MKRSTRMLVLSQLLALAALAACGGDGASDSEAVQAPVTSPGPGPGPSPSPGADPAPEPSPTPSPTKGSARLWWTPPQGAAVLGYRVYHGSSPQTYGQALGEGALVEGTSHTIGDLTTGRTWYFAVTAVDAEGNESAFSNEASKFVP